MERVRLEETVEAVRRELETTRRRLWLACLPWVVVVFASLAPSAHQDVVTAKRFVVLDDSGMTRIVLGLSREQVSTGNRGPDTEYVEKELAALRVINDDGLIELGDTNRYSGGSMLAISHEHRDRTWFTSLSSSGLSSEYDDDEIKARARLVPNELDLSMRVEDESRSVELSAGEDGPARLVVQDGEEESVFPGR